VTQSKKGCDAETARIAAKPAHAGTAPDIETDRLRRTQEELRMVSAYNRSLTEASPNPLVTIDSDGRVTDVNTATERVTGYRREELVGTDFSNYFTDPERARAGYYLVLQHDTIRDYELEIRHRDGHVTPVLYSASVYRDDAGKVRAVFAAARDISERRRAEEALWESEERYRTAIESASDGIALVKGDQHLYVNARFAEMFGYDDPAEIVGKPLSLTVHPEDVEMVTRYNRLRQVGEPAPSRYEFKGVRKDGAIRFMEVSAAKTSYRGQTLSLVYFRDVTEYRNLEEQLRQSQKMQAIGTLAGGIAHDFNNILAGIIGFTEMSLEDIAPDNPVRPYLERVLKGGYRGRDLVRQILTFSRQGEQEKKSISLGIVIEEALQLIRPALPSIVEIEKRLHQVQDTILADPVQLQQVVMNLCTNAAYAMRDTGGVLAISLHDVSCEEAGRYPDLEPGAYLRLTVSDTGCGMTREVMSKIFDPFFTTKRPGEGTGMGLSVVHGIVKSHGGHVTVSSAPGKGSTFHVYLPKAEPPATVAAESLSPIPGGNESILFVDDEETLVDLNSLRLQGLGYRVVATTNGKEALRIFAGDPSGFDLIITDYTMPSMTGIDLAGKFLELRPDIPIILASGQNESIEPDMIDKAGIKAYLRKTANKRELAELIRRVLAE